MEKTRELKVSSEYESGLSRRGFLKSTAIGAVGLASVGILSACTPAETPSGSDTPSGSGSNATASQTAGGQAYGVIAAGDWLGEPPTINSSSIAETIEADVVVVGGGHSGTLAALGAIEEGASVAVIETQPWSAFVDVDGDGVNRGGWYGSDIGHVNSKWLIAKGFGPYNTGEICYEFVKRTLGRCNPDIIKKYIQNSGAMVDREMEIYDSFAARRQEEDSAVFINKNLEGEENVTADFSNMTTYPYAITHHAHESVKTYPIICGDYKTWPCNIQFYGNQGNNIEYFMKYIHYHLLDKGAEYYFEHTAVVLVQDSAGAVTGVIVEDVNNPGSYKQFNARKGVVMAAGDFKGNPQMCWALLTELTEWAMRNDMTVADFEFTATRDGSGHKMMTWAGATMEATPRGTMGTKGGPSRPFGAAPFLMLNKNGKRFYNEAGSAISSGVIFRQPAGNAAWVSDKKIWQTMYLGGLDHGAPNYGKEELNELMMQSFETIEVDNPEGSMVTGNGVAESATMGSVIFAASTLDKLVDFLGYEGESKTNFLAEIDRYNKLCASADGDTDYGKEKRLMLPVDEPPYYGNVSEMNSRPSYGLVTLAGVVADAEFRVLRNGNIEEPIKGLYTCGNCLGNRYSGWYVTPMAGNSVGIAQTTGWLAGKNAAREV
jgi:succinate dehydrogenase/fumarate reductase flavoprotein subunit